MSQNIDMKDVRQLIQTAKENYNAASPRKISQISLRQWLSAQEIMDVLAGDDDLYNNVTGCYVDTKQKYGGLVVEYETVGGAVKLIRYPAYIVFLDERE